MSLDNREKCPVKLFCLRSFLLTLNIIRVCFLLGHTLSQAGGFTTTPQNPLTNN